ncbi:MAG TPA: MAPEG family protein [Allosphingosinicella sp.]|nr:MAPEG family protein [Allosphingosinicella sp.]
MILPMTLTMAAALTLLNIWLARRVGQMRVAHKVALGDGGVEPLIARMRAQANFVEWAPFFLILLAGIELARGEPIWVWVLAALFAVARILHALGMDRPRGNRLRMIGMIGSTLIMLALAIYAIVIVYRDQTERVRPVPHITYMARAST